MRARAHSILAVAVAVVAIAGCGHRRTAPTKIDDAAADAAIDAAPDAIAAAPIATGDPCARRFAAGRLAALARDPEVLRPWGKLIIDEAAKTATELPPDGHPGDPGRVARAWGATLPPAYAELLGAFDGCDLRGTGGHVEIWNTSLAVELAGERTTPGRAIDLLPIGTDGGDYDVVIDLGNAIGKGRCAVYLSDQGGSDVYLVASDLVAAVDRIVAGDDAMDGPTLYRPESSLPLE